MKFDSVAQKKEKQSRQLKRKKKELAQLTKVYPVAGIDAENIVELTTQGQTYYALYFDPKKYDLDLLDDETANFITETYWGFHKQYEGSVKELFMNFPEENQAQQEYVKYKRDHAKEYHQIRILQSELDKLKYLEKTYKKFASYLVIYGKTRKELTENLQTIRRFNALFQLEPLKREKVEKIIYLLNNSGGITFDDERNHVG